MYVANIVTKTNLNVDKYFNIVQSIDEIIDELPTLVIGWDIVKTINPNADFIDKKLSNNIFWTFKKTERRDIFEEDLYYFIKHSYNLLIKNIEYIFIDLILFSDSELKTTFEKIKKSPKVIGYKYNNMLYLYTNKTIYGFDLKLLKYLDLDSDKTIEKIKSYCSVFLTDTNILIEYKDIIEMINNEVKYIPYVHSTLHNG